LLKCWKVSMNTKIPERQDAMDKKIERGRTGGRKKVDETEKDSLADT